MITEKLHFRFLRFALLSVTLFSMVGCSDASKAKGSSTFFGGEIINPKGEDVILYNRRIKLSDTLKLDSNNRFSHKIENLEPGVYTFWHGGEIQFVILEPNDSVMIRLNTYEFDKSLVFTGNGAKKNNYLIKTFLNNEDKSRNLVKYSQNKAPEDFETYIDDRHEKELNEFEAFKEKNSISNFASSVIKANIDYHNYADKEIYPFAYFGENKMVHLKDLPEGFYDFRKNIDYNASHLSDIFAYNRYLFFHFDNLAVTDYYQNNTFHSKFNRHQLSYNKTKLNLVDSLVTDEIIKNNLLKYKTREFINHSKNQDEVNEIMASYLAKTTSEEDIKYLNGLIASLNNLQPGKGLPDLIVIDVEDKEYTIAEIVDKPTLIYFWSTNKKEHYKNSHYRVKELQTEFPKMGFMSININDNPDKFWKETINKYNFNLGNEYRFKNPKEALKTLAVNYLYKVIIVDNKANIVNPNVNIFSEDFETLLKDMIQKKELVLK
ncbi:AhpC/TSA family protein [Winogradskyella wandonensis]|uniref:AhpC/TSA family protein n=1 Tax=Winogradskyella wandonensis TaxID=1442586 RepID=A0A4V2PU37_9FLAO|nr:redoxin domain-containing protein [Winogradskyella wandonensis]TCK68971.1 AhpC/TSA family protein [Winogradskyella wandonensis]